RTLYAGARNGVFRRDLPAAAAGVCQPGTDHLCLLGSRFRVDLHVIDPSAGTEVPTRATARGERFGSFGFPTPAGDPDLPRIFVRMDDDASEANGGQGFSVSSLSDVPYSVVVTDTSNGRVQTYDGRRLCGAADALAFPASASSSRSNRGLGSVRAPEAAGDVLALLSGRFRVAVTATDPQTGASVGGSPVPQDDGFGYFALPALTGDANVPEVLVEMSDSRSLENADFSISHGGMTGLAYTLTVTDSVSGLARIYRSDRVEPTRPCGGADLRVTTGPPPVSLSGDWPAASSFSGSLARTGIASVRQSGDQVSFRNELENGSGEIHFRGSLHDGLLEGVLQYEGLLIRSCHLEGTARGTATGSSIRLETESLAGTCGDFGAFTLELVRARESVGLSARRSRIDVP
ncbi:MAG TPA: hypothetical protein VIA45_12475, partial [Thermoanaerobaculia bacterium]